MSELRIALKSLLFHWRVNLAVALGVMAATAVLTGALIVGDSMRGSLRELTLDRLGDIDVMIFSEGFFREELASELVDSPEFQAEYGDASSAIYFSNGTAERRQQGVVNNLGEVNVLGIHHKFWSFGDESLAMPDLADDEVIINEVVAEDLRVTRDQITNGNVRLTIGIPRQKLLPSDSALGAKDDLMERIVDMKVVDIVPARSLGRFGLHPTQIPPRNVYVSIDSVQDALNDGILKYKESREQANVILVSAKEGFRPISEARSRSLARQIRPRLPDLGLSLKRVTRQFDGETVFDYFNLASDRLVIPNSAAASIRKAFPDSVELFTYLANDIRSTNRVANIDQSGIPFSMVTAVDLSRLPLPSVNGNRVKPLGKDEIAITRWAAEDQGLSIGDTVTMTWFEPETTHGDETEVTRELMVADIVELIEPVEPPGTLRPTGDASAVYDKFPSVANDPDMTPEVPGLTDAESIERWDLPFATADRIRSQDDDYWTWYRTTPKAFVSLETGRELWASRFGSTTSFRIPPGNLDASDVSDKLLDQFRVDDHLPGIQVVPVKANGLKASSGATPFDALFLSLSMFVIGAALVLVSLLFRLGLQQRSGELGTLLATGFRQSRVSRLWLLEMSGVSIIGALAGALAGVGYAFLMLYGLKTWWVGAITTPFLELHINWWTIPLGLFSGTAICIVTILGSVRAARKKSVRSLLSGQIESRSGTGHSRFAKHARLIMVGCGLIAVALTILAATRLAGESQAGAFMTSGFLILVAALVGTWQKLRREHVESKTGFGLNRLSLTNAARNPLRSTLTIGLVAVASFLILAISAFRLSPTEQGTAGFNYVAKTSQPIFANLNSAEGQRNIIRGDNDTLDPSSEVFSFRYKPGEDASCNNPYQSSQPRVLGVTEAFVNRFDNDHHEKFDFAMTSGDNPWHLLDSQEERNEKSQAIPVIIDKNTAWYSLKIYMPGTEFTIEYDSGESVNFRLAGLLSNSVLQGSLLIAESDFTRAFPDISGYRYFLLKLKDETEAGRLTTALSDQGFNTQETRRLLSGFLAVQNTYLSTFQSLGLLGLLLGTFGLAAVQLRAVMERRKELGLMRAVGFTRSQLATMILIENACLLLAGMAIGIGASLVTTLPHYFFGDASVPWQSLLLMFALITATGLLTGWLASRKIYKAPLIESLRAA